MILDGIYSSFDRGGKGVALKTQTSTGVDKSLRLEAVYYASPIPRNLPALTILGAVFDRVYFPEVCMPVEGFDQQELDKEIERIERVVGSNYPGDMLLPVLRFVRYARQLRDFCIFTGDKENPFSSKVPSDMVKDIFETIHGPPPPNWEPLFETNHHKVMPGSEEHVTYPGDYHYLAGSILHSAETGIPLLNDVPGLPIPGLDQISPAKNAKALSAILAIECTKIALPEIPLLRPADLMEFRAENKDALRAFRRSMLRYASDLGGLISGDTPEEIDSTTRFFVETEIVPVLDELRSSMNAPGRPWHKRAVDFVRVIPELATAFMTLDPQTALGKVLTTYAGQLFSEAMAAGDQREALKRSGLYYLLKLQTYQSDRQR